MQGRKLIVFIAIITLTLGFALYAVFILKPKSSPEIIYQAQRDKIVFNSNRDGKIDVWLMDRDGKGLVQLTENQGNNLGPQWNGDKSKIIFVSDRDGGNYELYIMNADGSGQKRLTRTPEEETWPSVSPDSRYGLFARGPKGGKHDIWKLDLAAGKEINLADTPEADELESWYDPEMTKIVFTSDRVKTGIYNCYLMDPDGSQIVNLTNSSLTEDHCIFNSKGDKITFARADAKNPDTDWDIWIMDADGSNQKPLVAELPDFTDCAPWSPDDDAIVFEGSANFEETGDIYLYEFKTGKLTNLTNSPDIMDLHPDW